MPSRDQLIEYAQIVLEYARKSAKKLTSRQLAKLHNFEADLVELRENEGSLDSLIVFNGLITYFTTNLIKQKNRPPVIAAMAENRINASDSPDQAQQKLEVLRDFTKTPLLEKPREQEEMHPRERLIQLLTDKAWHSVTSAGARTPAGFKEILRSIRKQSAWDGRALMEKMGLSAFMHSGKTLERTFFRCPRDPHLQKVYKEIREACALAKGARISETEALTQIIQILEAELTAVKEEQAHLAITRGPFSR